MKRKMNSRVILFWALAGIITIAFAIIIVFRCIDAITYDDYEDINKSSLNINLATVFSERAEGEYYVFIYKAYGNYNNDNSIQKAEELKPLILNYYNFVKQNKRKNPVPIYTLNIENMQNQGALTTTGTTSTTCSAASSFRVNEKDLPLIIKCDSGAIEASGVLKTFEEIQKSFQEIWEYYLGTTNIVCLVPNNKEQFLC